MVGKFSAVHTTYLAKNIFISLQCVRRFCKTTRRFRKYEKSTLKNDLRLLITNAMTKCWHSWLSMNRALDWSPILQKPIERRFWHSVNIIGTKLKGNFYDFRRRQRQRSDASGRKRLTAARRQSSRQRRWSNYITYVLILFYSMFQQIFQILIIHV